MNTKKKIIILGCNGFVGKNLTSKLFLDNYETIGFDKSQCNLLNSNDIDEILNKHKPEIIINCAGRIGSSEENKGLNQFDLYHENIMINLNLLKCSKTKKFIEKIFFFSSYRSYKEDSSEHLSFGNILNSPNRGYLLNKIHLDNIIEIFRQELNIEIINFIIPNLYGINDLFKKESRVVPSLIFQIDELRRNNISSWTKQIENTYINLVYIEQLISEISKLILQFVENQTISLTKINQPIDLANLIFLIRDIIYPDLQIILIDKNNKKIIYEKLNYPNKELISNLTQIYNIYKINNGIL